ncbi:MAG: hypothetical protein ACI4TM_08375 [Candidatus Cryptobacteroides sp.]
MEPPSPIITGNVLSAESQSDDPLSGCIFIVTDSPSGDEGYFVCAWSARTGLSYIGSSDGMCS